MTDARLRELEHRWKTEASLTSEVEYLRGLERGRALSPERIALAATCGSRAAAELAGHDCGASMEPCLRCWREISLLQGLAQRGGKPLALRLAIAGSRLVYARWRQVHEAEGWTGACELAWLHHQPRPAGALLPGDWKELSATVDAVLRGATAAARSPDLACSEDAWSAQTRLRRYPSPYNLRWAKLPLDVLARDSTDHSYDWKGLTYRVESDALFDALSEAVVPWLLGYSDPCAP